MRPSTIAKTLALFSGAGSVVARSLPAQRSEISIRAAGGHGFRNPLETLEDADANVDNAVSQAANQAATTNVDDLTQRLEGMGLVKVSEDMLDGHIYTGTYSIPVKVTLSKRDTVLEKRVENIEGARCLTACGPQPGVPSPNPDDCAVLYNRLHSMALQFTVEANQVTFFTEQNCGAFFVNNKGNAVTYDYWDFGGTSQWLNGECNIRHNMAFGGCVFGGDFSNSAYIAVVHPSYFGK